MKQKAPAESKSGPSDADVQPEQYIPYFQARSLLADRIEAEPEEIAIWSYSGSENGGLTAYLDPYIFIPPVKLQEIVHVGPDYLSPLTTCWFRTEEISRFQPADDERYMSSSKLVARWSEQVGSQVEAFIEAMVGEGYLTDLHPHAGRTQWREDEHYPGREWAIFPLNQVKQIEAKYFPESPSSDQNLIATNSIGVLGVSAKRIIRSFNFWDEERWKALLSRPPRWLEDARIKPVVHRKGALWNPAVLGNCLLAYRLKYWYSPNKYLQQFASAIPSKTQLERIVQENFPEWLSEWQPDLE